MSTQTIKIYENGHRKTVIKKVNPNAIIPSVYKFTIDLYYDGFPDYEWKRGSGGIACDLCKTLEQAKRKAKHYVNKQ